MLQAVGFDVTLKLDASRTEQEAAVQGYLKLLAARKGVGLFYYAGHGVQLAWRNYMLPVDIDVRALDDIPKQGVEVNSLLEGLTKAANPMNVIILDACRDNPFGNLKGLDQKGLSQMDAPNATLLAYATSPGNAASDGDGANGRYTENPLREIKAKEARIEDLFKRVRLNVRLAEVLEDAGIHSAHCAGLIALAGGDAINQAIAIGARVLNPDLMIVARAKSRAA